MILLLWACSGDKNNETSCDELPPLPTLAGCLSNIAGGDIQGTVTAIGEGPFPGDCSNGVGEDPGTGVWLTVEDADGNRGTVGLAIPGLKLVLAEGDQAHLIAGYAPGDFGPTLANLEIRDSLDTMVGWLGEGGEVARLTPPLGFVISQGPEVCESEDECGSWAAYDLVVEVNGERKTVTYGKSAGVGGWTVYHAGNLQELNWGGVLIGLFLN